MGFEWYAWIDRRTNHYNLIYISKLSLFKHGVKAVHLPDLAHRRLVHPSLSL